MRRFNLVLVASTVFMIAGCSITIGHGSGKKSSGTNGGSTVTSQLKDNKLTLDFRQRPTRESFGMSPDANVRFYDPRGGVEVTMIFKTGQITVPAFGVSGDTDGAGGANDKNLAHDPKDFQVSRRFASGVEARASLMKSAGVLGIGDDEINRLLPQLGTGAVVPQRGILHGFVDDWLDTEVELMDGDDGQVLAYYKIGIDFYHNPAFDRVVHGGVFTADLTKRPTRAALGMLDTYGSYDKAPAWGTKLALSLTLPGGVVMSGVDFISVSSGEDMTPDTAGVHAPTSAYFRLAFMHLDTARKWLAKHGPALRINQSDVDDAVAHPGAQKALPTTGTDIYDLRVRVTMAPSAGPLLPSCSIDLYFTFH